MVQILVKAAGNKGNKEKGLMVRAAPHGGQGDAVDGLGLEAWEGLGGVGGDALQHCLVRLQERVRLLLSPR